MQEKHLYEYAVIRVLPVVERDEFLNAGIILFCKQAKFISVLFKLNEEKLQMLSKDLDLDQIKQNLNAFVNIALGKDKCGSIGLMDLPSRFRWLTAVRSSVIQTSRPHPGLSKNLMETAQRLFEELV